jgi:outer membrane protein assembly factor BamB
MQTMAGSAQSEISWAAGYGTGSRDGGEKLLIRLFRAGFAVSFLSCVTGVASSADWPQYRGPSRDGKSTEIGLVRSWGPDGPREVWRVPIGAGFSGPSVVGDRVYTMDSNDETEYALCLDAETGKTLWRVPIGPIFRDVNGDGPRAAPTVDGAFVYVLGSRGRLAALDTTSGKAVWEIDYPKAFGSEFPVWAFTSAPLVAGDLLIVEVGGTGEKAIAALDKRTGEVRWTSQKAKIAYSSPIAVDLGGVRQLVFLLQEKLVGLDTGGQELWGFPWAPRGSIKPALPVFVPPDRILVGASYDIGAALVKVGSVSAWSAEEVWSSRFLRTHINTAVVLGEHIYGFDTATLRCLDAGTGERGWAKRGLGKGSLIYADGMIIVLSERGKLLLLEATPERYQELAAHQVLEGRCWTAPSLADGRLYLRNHTELVCLDLHAGSRSEPATREAR